MALGQNIEQLIIPSDPSNVVERPLTKGMRLDLPPQLLEPGAVLDAKNLLVATGGLKRRPGYSEFTVGNVLTYPPFQDMVAFWRVNGTQELLVIDQKHLYVVTPAAGYTKVYDSYSTGSVTVVGTAVTGAGTDWQTTDAATTIYPGDLIVLDANGSGGHGGGAGPELKLITGVSSDTALTIDSVCVGTYNAGTDYVIYRTFKVAKPYFVDWCVISGGVPAVVFADYGRYLRYYDGTYFRTFNLYSGTKTENFLSVCVAYHMDRLWVGDIVIGGATVKQRIKWTPLGSFNDFTATGSGTLDLPYTQGALKRLVPLGDFLVAYFDDAVFIGRPSNNANLPLIFKQVETGNVGLLGMRAVCKWLDAHFFVGQDDIYVLTPRGLQGIGTPIVKATVKRISSGRHWMVQAVPDPNNDRIVFGFPYNADQIDTVWSYNYRTQAWSYDEIDCHMLANSGYVNVYTWEDFVTQDYSAGTCVTNGTTTLTGSGTLWNTGTNVAIGDKVLIDIDNDGQYEFQSAVSGITNDTQLTLGDIAPTSGGANRNYRIIRPVRSWEGAELADYATWDAIRGSSTTVRDLYVGITDVLYRFDRDGQNDAGQGIPISVITRDMDFNAPDEDKFYGSLSLKLEEPAATDIAFSVEGSVDRGDHWKALGTLTIAANKDEQKVNFRMTGSIARFRLTSVTDVAPYTINEIVVRARMRGREVPGRSDQS